MPITIPIMKAMNSAYKHAFTTARKSGNIITKLVPECHQPGVSSSTCDTLVSPDDYLRGMAKRGVHYI